MPGRSKLHLRAGGMAKNPLNSDDEGSDSSDDDRSSSSSGTDIGLSDDASSRRSSTKSIGGPLDQAGPLESNPAVSAVAVVPVSPGDVVVDGPDGGAGGGGIKGSPANSDDSSPSGQGHHHHRKLSGLTRGLKKGISRGASFATSHAVAKHLEVDFGLCELLFHLTAIVVVLVLQDSLLSTDKYIIARSIPEGLSISTEISGLVEYDFEGIDTVGKFENWLKKSVPGMYTDDPYGDGRPATVYESFLKGQGNLILPTGGSYRDTWNQSSCPGLGRRVINPYGTYLKQGVTISQQRGSVLTGRFNANTDSYGQSYVARTNYAEKPYAPTAASFTHRTIVEDYYVADYYVDKSDSEVQYPYGT